MGIYPYGMAAISQTSYREMIMSAQVDITPVILLYNPYFMKRVCLAATALIMIFTTVTAQDRGTAYDDKILESKVLKGPRKYSIYLPPDYSTSSRSYPILYLLHPAGPANTIPNQESWVKYGELKQYLDKAIRSGAIVPMIVVTPDANFGSKRISYFNDPEGDFSFEDFFFSEFIPHIEKNYRIYKDKDSRAIAGSSMGGAAAFFYALHHPELFATSSALSAAVRPYDKQYLQTRYANVEEGKLVEWYAAYNVYELFKKQQADQKMLVKWFIACGDDDALSANNAQLHIDLRKGAIKHEFRMQDGLHDWAYWRSMLPDMMLFVSSNFKK